jgi:hypothetical protein
MGNQVFRLFEEEKKMKKWDLWKKSPKTLGEFKNRNSLQDDKY